MSKRGYSLMAELKWLQTVASIRHMVLACDTTGIKDAALLKLFVNESDGAAFDAIVRRHGPLVYGVCLRVLQNASDAEDAFQATFLVLVRKAAGLKRPELLGNWLHGVAFQTARSARATARRHRKLESRLIPRQPHSAPADPDDLSVVLDEELQRLPAKYRIAIVLCELQEMSRKDAAAVLAVPEGTVSSRLARGKTLLAKSLRRRNITLGSAAIGVFLASTSVAPSVALVQLTVVAGTAAMARKSAAIGIASIKAIHLSETVIKMMFVSKLKWLGLLIVGTVLFMTGAGLLGAQSWHGRLPALPAQEKSRSSKEENATTTVTGVVLDNKGQRVKSGQVWLPVKIVNPLETLTATAKFTEVGAFRLTFPTAWNPPNEMRFASTVWAYSPGYAIGTGNAHKQLTTAATAEPVQVELPPAGDLSVVVLLPDGKPAVGAKVQPNHFQALQHNYEIVPPALVELVAATTDEAGRAALPALTRDGVFTIDVKAPGLGTQKFRCDRKSTEPAEQTLRLRNVGRIVGSIATENLDLSRDMFVSVETSGDALDKLSASGMATVKVGSDGRFTIPEIATGSVSLNARCKEELPVRVRLPERGTLRVMPGETNTVSIKLERAVRVHGMVRAKDTQKPLAGVRVAIRYGVGQQGDHAVTNEKGEYSALALSGKVYVHLIDIPNGYIQMGSPWQDQQAVPARAQEYAWPTIDVVPSTEVSGKVLDGKGKPMAKVRINGLVGDRRYGFGNTDQDGVFKLPGVPQGIQLEKFEIWTRDEHFTGVIEIKKPMVVRVQN